MIGYWHHPVVSLSVTLCTVALRVGDGDQHKYKSGTSVCMLVATKPTEKGILTTTAITISHFIGCIIELRMSSRPIANGIVPAADNGGFVAPPSTHADWSHSLVTH